MMNGRLLLELDNTDRRLHEHGKNIVTMINRKNRMDAILRNDRKENLKMSACSDASRKSKSKRKDVEKCHHPFCCITIHDQNVEWVQCDLCDNWLHTMCDGLTPEEEMSLSNQEYTCITCKGIYISEVLDNKIAQLLSEEDDIIKSKIEAKVKCDNFKAQYVNMQGEKEKMLNDALEEIKVVRQAYHGNVMVGNHSVIILKKYKVLTSVIEEDVVYYSRFNEIFDIFSQAMHYIMVRRFLNDDEIERLEVLTIEFGEKFPIYFPNRNITRKIHEFIFNLVPFVKKFKTIGMLSEQESESKHAAINAALRSVACVRNHAERIRLVVEREELRSYMNKNLVKPASRLCNKCPRTFLRAAKDGNRHCPSCEKQHFHQ